MVSCRIRLWVPLSAPQSIIVNIINNNINNATFRQYSIDLNSGTTIDWDVSLQVVSCPAKKYCTAMCYLAGGLVRWQLIFQPFEQLLILGIFPVLNWSHFLKKKGGKVRCLLSSATNIKIVLIISKNLKLKSFERKKQVSSPGPSTLVPPGWCVTHKQRW